ncbi:MAG TPA: methylated-DNA--[protein]-cysteine S-methyltransferase [Rickettsiales bacterium]|nr:methylated-DNA--[protein]-cysteine S-methyltransferase [Rickettsiales bacterium]
MTTQYYTTMPSPLGEIVLTSDGACLTGLYVPRNTHYTSAQQGTKDSKPFHEVIKQLEEYFAGKRRDFDLSLAPRGTAFQQRVWQQLCRIPHGETRTYGKLAQAIGQPTASRAVGLANGQNPIGIIVPCHRVIGSNGKLTGYNGGVEVKQWLLDHESGRPKLPL